MSVWNRSIVGLTLAKLACGLAIWAVDSAGRGWAVPAQSWLFVALILEFTSIAALLIWQRPGGDVRARLLGTIFLLVASPFSDPLFETAASRSSQLLQSFERVMPALRMDAWLPALFWMFARCFPEPLTSPKASRWIERAAKGSLVVGGVLFALNLFHALASATALAQTTLVTSFLSNGDVYWTVLFLAAMPMWPFLVWRARHSRADQRRRTTLFVAGLTLGLVPVTIEVILEALIPRYQQIMQGAAGTWTSAVIYLSLASTPIVTAYSVLVDRVVDARFFLRAAAQYSLARYTILSAILVPVLTLAAYVYLHRDQSLTQILSGPGPLLLAALSVTALVALALRDRVLLALDRRFFRERYDARLILRRLADEPRRSMNLRDLASHVTTEIDRALHLHSVALLVADDRGEQYRSLDGRVRPLPVTSRLPACFAEDPSPLEIDLESAHSSLRGLPVEDRQWLADCAVRLLLPIVGSDSSLLGFLALGDKRSELAFSRDDHELLGMIQASLALSLENRRLRASPSRTPGTVLSADQYSDSAAIECADCWSVHQPETTHCPCGGRLRPAPVPFVLLGKFRFDKRVGAGGMGVVYRAVDLALDRYVAIKTLPQVSPEYANRLRREARAMAVVSHPHLALIYGAEMWHGTPMLVCEYLSGGTLADRLRTGRLSQAEALDLGLELADVLEHIHSVGVLHCDIKPSNIGYTAAKSPKLLDFGLARLVGDSQPLALAAGTTTRSARDVFHPATALGSTAPTDSRQFIGTPLYMCPEAIRRDPPTALNDLWSLTVVLFETIAGTPPFNGRGVLDILQRVTEGDRPDIRDFQPECAADLADFFRTALARDKAARPQTADALRKALSTLRAGQGPV